MFDYQRIVSTVAVLLLLPTLAQAEKNWPRWRGPHQDGHSHEESLPVDWTPDTVVWKANLPGRGQSSPIIWGEKIFLTAALEDGRQRVLFCLDRGRGELRWQQVAWTGEPEPTHKMNGWASSTMTTDGDRVYAFFGRGGGLHCYSTLGERLWSVELGTFEGPWGTAASPLLVGDLVVQNCDADRNARLIAFDKHTGKEVWNVPREEIRGWSSPILVDVGGRMEIVMNGHSAVRGYDPNTGAELWSCKSFNGRGCPTVTPANGNIFVVNGLKGDVYAVHPGGMGDVTETNMLWHTPRNTGRDLPSPIIVGDQMLVVNMQGGILTSYATNDGKELWKERIGGNYSASPVAYQDRAFFVAESGTVNVIDPTQETKVVGQNSVGASDDEVFRSSMAMSEGQVFLRSDRVLYVIGERIPSNQ